jgi:hypothetical protein
MALGAALVVTAVILTAVALVNHRSGLARHKAADLAPSISPLFPASPSAGAPAAARSTAPQPTVLLRWTGGASWIRIRDGKGTVLLVGGQPRGTVKSFTGASFSIEIADAGAVTVSIKGGAPHLAGAAGKSARLTVAGP